MIVRNACVAPDGLRPGPIFAQRGEAVADQLGELITLSVAANVTVDDVRAEAAHRVEVIDHHQRHRTRRRLSQRFDQSRGVQASGQRIDDDLQGL